MSSYTQVPPNGPREFVEDYTIKKVDTKVKQALLCDQCEERSKAVSYCSTCSEYLCEECLRAHKRLKAYRSHETVSTASKSFSATKHQSKKSYNCIVHPNEWLKLYCKTCSTLACLHCFVSSHNGHDVGSIDSKTRKVVEASIRDLVKETDSKLTEFEENLKYISAVEKKKSKESAPLKAEIDKKVDSLIAQLEARRAELHKEVDDAITKDQKEVWAQKEYHETSIVSLRGALSFAKRSLNCQEDIELLALNVQITSRLKELSQLKWKSQSIEKVELTAMRFEETHNAPLSAAALTTQVPQFEQDDLRFGPAEIPISEDEDEFFDDTVLPVSKLVGELHTTTSHPSLKLSSDLESCTAQQGCSVSFQITADILIGTRKGHKNANITGSVTYEYSEQEYGFDQRDVSRSSSALVKKDANANSWTVTFTPQCEGTSQIVFTAEGQYGNRAISSTHYSKVYTDPEDEYDQEPLTEEYYEDERYYGNEEDYDDEHYYDYNDYYH